MKIKLQSTVRAEELTPPTPSDKRALYFADMTGSQRRYSPLGSSPWPNGVYQLTSAMEVYLDNSVVSAIGRDDIAQESDSILKVLKLYNTGRLNLWTSKFTGEEIEKAPVDKRRSFESIYLVLKKVPHVERQKLLGINVYWDLYTSINSPMIEDDPIWSKLRATGLDENDAYHLMLAVKAECDVFLTVDYKDFTNNKPRKSRIEQEFKIRLMTPTELANDPSLR